MTEARAMIEKAFSQASLTLTNLACSDEFPLMEYRTFLSNIPYNEMPELLEKLIIKHFDFIQRSPEAILLTYSAYLSTAKVGSSSVKIPSATFLSSFRSAISDSRPHEHLGTILSLIRLELCDKRDFTPLVPLLMAALSEYSVRKKEHQLHDLKNNLDVIAKIYEQDNLECYFDDIDSLVQRILSG